MTYSQAVTDIKKQLRPLLQPAHEFKAPTEDQYALLVRAYEQARLRRYYALIEGHKR